MAKLKPTHGKILPNDQLDGELVDSLNLRGRLFYLLPKKLLNAIQNELPDALSSKKRDLEVRLSDHWDTSDAIAVRDERLVGFIRLSPYIKPLDRSIFESSSAPNTVVAEAGVVLQDVHDWSQAYLGWLVQNQEFQSDVLELRKLGCQKCSPLGAPSPYPAVSDGQFSQLFCPEHQSVVRKVCRKWRLDGFATLDLPMPLEPHFVACSPYNENAREGGAAPFIPDTYPVKGRGELLNRIRATQPSRGAEHLNDWMETISPTSKKSARLTSLARQFRLQHYWRIVHDRYSDGFAGRKTDLYQAFADFLDENVETIRKEVPKLVECLKVPLSRWW